MAQIESLSKAEAVKQQSRQLRGNLAQDLADVAAPFDNTGYSLLKFHGIYQGYDRDSATERKQRGDDKLWQFMVRVRIPGGRLTAAQYLALDGLADRYANGSLRITDAPGWKRVHRHIPAAIFTAKPVYRRSNCAACHADAGTGQFAPQGIAIPNVAAPE